MSLVLTSRRGGGFRYKGRISPLESVRRELTGHFEKLLLTDDFAPTRIRQLLDIVPRSLLQNVYVYTRYENAQLLGVVCGCRGDTSRPFGSYNIAKRAQHNKQYGFGLGKRLYRQYEFGLGKRSASKQYGFGLGKRAAAEQYQFGLGKRVAPTFYNFGLGRRASPQYSFGLGKRMSRPSFLNVDEKEADYTYNDLSEEKKRTTDDMMSMGHGQRFAFGLGKRAAADWDDGGGVDDDGDLALAVPIWHPAVRRARLQYGFGLGKRADDYDGGEYASDPQPDDDATAIDLN
ncbi:Hypothetical protein CINCED_3A005822 [Cinara cedri]|uniref:Uncharacterized protein n=1 Tax=Cinara cedri TaxID=506608 RepID=A0A5E4N165_9HEMI|nr:Hypothetical protein CINCED_3A005822 [Cinara cedri]